MRGLIVWLVILTAVFFIVGRTHGWYLGVPSHTPVFVYRMTADGEATRQTLNVDALPVRLSGRVHHGSVEVKILYQRPESFQGGTQAGSAHSLFEHIYQQGDQIAIDQSFKDGKGDYRVELLFKDATGLFRLVLPDENQL
ncbi:MAG: hypothetical protein P8Z81_13980 [Deinococcales bacterium]